MPNMTAQEVVEAAYRKLSKSGLDAVDLNAGLQDLQNMLSEWSVAGLNSPFYITDVLTLVTGQSTYSIGLDTTAGDPDFEVQRPLSLVSGFIRIDNLDYFVNVNMTEQEYSEIILKGITIRPRNLFFDPQYPNAILQFDYEADTGLEFHLTSIKPIQNPVSLGETFNLPPAYNKPIIFNLAVMLTSDNNSEISPTVLLEAERSLKALKRYNAKLRLSPKVRFDYALLANSRYGYYRSDIFRGF